MQIQIRHLLSIYLGVYFNPMISKARTSSPHLDGLSPGDDAGGRLHEEQRLLWDGIAQLGRVLPERKGENSAGGGPSHSPVFKKNQFQKSTNVEQRSFCLIGTLFDVQPHYWEAVSLTAFFLAKDQAVHVVR